MRKPWPRPQTETCGLNPSFALAPSVDATASQPFEAQLSVRPPAAQPVKHPAQHPVEIVRAPNPRAFVEMPRTLYQDDPHWVPPMLASELWRVDKAKHPFFAHGDGEFFLAMRDGVAVGRVSVARDEYHDSFHDDAVGFFGHFEATDESVAHALLEHARAWLTARGAQEFRGPVDLTTNYRCGLLLPDESEPGPPAISMPHNPAVYAEWFESFGLRKAKDLIALFVMRDRVDDARLNRIVDRIKKRTQVVVRPIDLKRLPAEFDLLWKLYHEIWERNWGFVPMSEAEFRKEASEFKALLRPTHAGIAEAPDGEPVGFIVSVPDANRAIAACNGKLWPMGWWRFLKALRATHHIRTLTLGVRPEYRKSGLEMLLMHRVIMQGGDAGVVSCEASWILEDNTAMLTSLRAVGFHDYRRYRIYTEALGVHPASS